MEAQNNITGPIQGSEQAMGIAIGGSSSSFSSKTTFFLERIAADRARFSKAITLVVRSCFASLRDSLNGLSSEQDTFDLVAGMTMLLLLLHLDHFWYLSSPVTVLCAAGILHRPLTRQAGYWLILAFVLAYSHALNWYMVYNHKYL